MKQLALNLRTGETLLYQVPDTTVKKGCLLIKTTKSLISTGTEQMLVDFGNASWFSKARQQSEKWDQVVGKIRSEGLMNTFQKLSRKLDQLLPLGYCQVGEVVAVGEGVTGFRVGERVVSNGCHAELVCVPANLTAKVPEHVADDDAVFTILAAVALHSIRLLAPALGETVAVIGLGLIGLLTVDLLCVNGCRVIGIEPDEGRRNLAAQRGCLVADPAKPELPALIAQATQGFGVDGVIIAASSRSDSIMRQAAGISKKRGKIVVAGAVGMHLRRSDLYEKELNIQLSCSYGPGRYDPEYEMKGRDYPFPYVRWTENRNFQAILQMLDSKMLSFSPLISQMIAFEQAEKSYQNSLRKNLATVFTYSNHVRQPVIKDLRDFTSKPGKPVIGMIGAGNFAQMTLLPHLKGTCIKYIASAGGLSAAQLARKYNIPAVTADFNEILNDPEVSLVMITTRHDQHATLILAALEKGKNVFVEKPLAILPEELDSIIAAQATSQCSISVGFNRRFSPYILKMRSLLGLGLMQVIITVNAGQLPENSWQNDISIGGGRIIGEACHFIDLVSFLANSRITAVCSNSPAGRPGKADENVSILIRLENGSTGVVNYLSDGHISYPKERIEVHCLGRTLVLEDFRSLSGFGFKGFGKAELGKDKGHAAQFRNLLETPSEPLFPLADIVNTTRATFAAVESLRTSTWILV